MYIQNKPLRCGQWNRKLVHRQCKTHALHRLDSFLLLLRWKPLMLIRNVVPMISLNICYQGQINSEVNFKVIWRSNLTRSSKLALIKHSDSISLSTPSFRKIRRAIAMILWIWFWLINFFWSSEEISRNSTKIDLSRPKITLFDP